MGSVLTPLFTGIENALDLPHASTGCNQCGEVCPVDIPLPGLMHRLREVQAERRLRPPGERLALSAWGWLAAHPAAYRLVIRLAGRYLRWLADESGRIRVFGLAPGWTTGRDLVPPGGRTFHELYAARKKN
jgi:L-lactate dehydrogenase complex protein LldF